MPESQTPPVHAALLGAPKAGTTSLYRYLVQHPALAGHPQREMTYFLVGEEFEQGHDAALAHYFAEALPSQRTVAKHVFHLMFPECLQRMHQHHPGIRLIAVLRNPIDRAYSAYWYGRRRGWENQPTFEQALDMEDERFAADPWANRTELYVRTGCYAAQLQQVIEVFGRDALHVVLTEDLKRDAAAVCAACFEHLGVDPAFVPDLTRVHNTAGKARSETVAKGMARFLRSSGGLKRAARKVVPKRYRHRLRHAALAMNETEFTPPPMAQATRDRLQAAFSSPNDELRVLLGRELE